MHMSDALVSPIVGGVCLLATAAIGAYSVKKIDLTTNEKKIPIMAVMGAFVFAAQMLNFSIPGTGSSGHIGGGLLLASVLGPYAGFLVMSMVLLVQALFFADGGLLAFGCNVINLGLFTCFIAYPFIFKKITAKNFAKGKLIFASVLATVIALQLGAFAVVLETYFSFKTSIPFLPFVFLMQPIHLAIGIVEGFLTAGVLLFIQNQKPSVLEINTVKEEKKKLFSLNSFIALFFILSLVMGGFIALFASGDPDGLEWALEKAEVSEALSKTPFESFLFNIQEKTAVFSDYIVKGVDEKTGSVLAGLIGSVLLVVCVVLVFICIKTIKQKLIKNQKEVK